MLGPLDVPGYDVLAPLGGSGRTWKAIAADDRSRVVLRRVHGDEATRRRLRQSAALWGSVPGRHVVAVHDVIATEPDVNLVVSDYAPGGGLDALLSRRGALDDAEVVTIVVPLAETLAAAHRRGLAHGRVSLGNIVFTDEGRPMLSDGWLLGSDADASDADVAALVAVAKAALGGRCSGPVYATLAAAPASAADLAAALRAAAPATPVRLHDIRAMTDEPPAARVEHRRHHPVGGGVGVGVGAVVAISLVAGVGWGHRDAARATRLPVPNESAFSASPSPATTVLSPEPSASSEPQPWWGIIRRLDDARVRSYTAALRRRGLRPVGLNVRLQSVDVLASSNDHAVVRVTDGWAAYELVDRNGRVVSRRPAHPRRVATLVLQRRSGSWRVQRQLG